MRIMYKMDSIKTFAKTYWQHARSAFDIVLLIVSVVALFFGTQVTLAAPLGFMLLFVVIIVAAYRTWLYQYKQTQRLVRTEEKEIKYNDLSDVQKAILRGMSTESDKQIVSIGTNAGVDFMGIGDAGESYDRDEIGAEIIELEKMDILRVDSYSPKSGRPIYKPTSLGFKILKQL